MTHSSEPAKLPGMWCLYGSIMQENDTANSLSVNTSEDEITTYLKEDLLSPLSSVYDYWKTNTKFPKL